MTSFPFTAAILQWPSCPLWLDQHLQNKHKIEEKKNVSLFMCCLNPPQTLQRQLWQWDHRVILPCVAWHKINSLQMESWVPAWPVKLTTLTLLPQAMHTCTDGTSGNIAATSHHILFHVLLLNPRFTTLARNVYLPSSHPSAHFKSFVSCAATHSLF